MKPLVVLYCNAIDERTLAERAIVTDSPAATRKVLGMGGALAAAGCEVVIVSMGRGRAGGRRAAAYRGRVGAANGLSIRYGPFVTVRGISEIVSMAWLLIMAMRWSLVRHRPVRHLFYNQFTAYLPALAWLRLVGARTVGDIEDGPINPAVQATLRTRGNADPALFARFISNGTLLACRALARSTTIRPTMPCYGALRLAAPQSAKQTEPLIVLLSGWIHRGTGGDLLLAALRLLVATNDARLDRLSIEVTGFGNGLEVLARAAAEDPRLRLVVHHRLEAGAYSALLDRAAVGLSLKTHEGAYADTTFPSKVMEYAERGLCIVSTDISDVRHIFGDAARYLTADDPDLLAAHLTSIADHPEEALQLGLDARHLVEQHFAVSAVGRNLRQFLFDNEAATT